MGSLISEIKHVFDLASLRRQAARQLSADDWAVFREIKQNHDHQRRFVNRQHEIDKPYKLAAARKELIDEGGARHRKLVHRWFGHDAFNREDIDRRAHARVSAGHQREHARIDRSEAANIKRLLEDAQAKGRLREMPKRDFQIATERRDQPERRVRQRA